MKMQIGLGLDSSLSLTFDQQRDMAKEAARLGYTSVWTPAGMTHDAFHICAQWSMASREEVDGGLTTGTSVLPVAMWSAPALAVQAGTVGDITGGRFILGIGAGSSFYESNRRSLGLADFPPVAMMRDYLITVRGLLAGEQVDYDGVAVKLHGVKLGFRPPRVPVYLGALGPQMLRLAGSHADGAALNWCTSEQVAWSRGQIAEGARKTGRDPSEVNVTEYIRICVDDDEDAARRSLARAVMGYAMARPVAPKDMGYRAHFARMGFDAQLNELEERQARGAPASEIAERFPRELLLAVGYFGPASGAASAFMRLAEGLDTAIVRVVASRPGIDSVLAVMGACRPDIVQQR
jgi:alkanesulfonate monooxygenase SsuD/methylene tetrahydromethanopterin reductase-like flavin-dependent oxidoreductase (luciferase family)